MRRIEILGPGCHTCFRAQDTAREAVARTGVEALIVHLADHATMRRYGVIHTPAMVIDGIVMSTGRIPSSGEIAAWLERRQQRAGVGGRSPRQPTGGPKMTDQDVLDQTLAFHGHRCWASTAGVRLGLAAQRTLGVDRDRSKELHAIVEIGTNHGGTCFADGIQHSTGCTFGKGNIEKTGEGKFAVTLLEKASGRRVRVAYRPTRQPRIAATEFMRKRAAGVPAGQIPEPEQQEVVDLVWDAPADEIMTVGDVFEQAWSEPAEIVRFGRCSTCGELVAEPYLVTTGDVVRCMRCAGGPA